MKFVFKFIIAFTFSLISIFPSYTNSGESNPAEIAKPTVKDRLNKMLKKDDIPELGENEMVVINLWATWCAPCIQEIPALNQLAKDYGDKGVRFLAFSEEAPSTYRKFLDRRSVFRFDYEQSFGNGNLVRYLKTLDRQNQGRAIPIHILIKRDGSIAEVMTGASHVNLVKIKAFLDAGI